MAEATSFKTRLMNSVEIPVLTRCCFCVPLRKGLICMAYLDLAVTCLVLPFLAYFIFSYDAKEAAALLSHDGKHMFPQLILELVLLMIELIMSIVFLIGLHMKKVPLMKAYLYFGIAFTLFSFVYNVVLTLISEETGNEFVLVIVQLIIHFYVLVLVWSSIIKMTRDGSVKYTRSTESV